MKVVCLITLLLLTGCGGMKQQDNNADKSARVHTELAGLDFERDRMGVALSEITLALQADPKYAPAFNVRGLIYMSLHEDQKADADFLQSLRLDKIDSEAQNNYGWFLCQRGKEKDSIGHFMAALENPLYATPERAYLNAGLCTQKAGELKQAEDFLQRALHLQPEFPQVLQAMAELKFSQGDYFAASHFFNLQKSENLTAEQLWLGIRIERGVGNANAEASYALQLRQRYPDARETQLLQHEE